MYKIILLFGIAVIVAGINDVLAQEVQLATFQETAQVIVDQKLSNDIISSITLQSTSNQEIRIPAELVEKIQNTDRVIAVVVTNENQCVLGVVDETCIMINVSREGIEGGIIAIQDTTKEIGDVLIGDINNALDMDAKYHSVYIHVVDDTNVALDTSGAVSGRGTVSVVYTVPPQDTDFLYKKFSAILLPKIIRESGGFYDVANNLSKEENSKMTFSIIPLDKTVLLQIKLATSYQDIASTVKEVNPLEYLKITELSRSNYFANGFYPLNSLLQVVILPDEPVKIVNVKGNELPTAIQGGEKIPTDVSRNGWVFDPESGDMVEGKYLFGKKFSINQQEFVFNLENIDGMDSTSNGKTDAATDTIDESQMLILGIIVAVAVGASVFYLKGYKAKILEK